MSCEACTTTWDGEPPCLDCPRPRELLQDNDLCWKLWSMLNACDRPRVMGMGGSAHLKLRSVDVARICEIYGASLEEFERIIRLEEEIYPVLAEKWNSQAQEKNGQD